MKMLRGCINSALLWYDLFSSTMMEMAFELNPYDTCIANDIINGKQFKTCQHMGKNKLRPANAFTVANVIGKFS